MRHRALIITAAILLPSTAHAADNLTTDWSNTTNPFGPWSMREAFHLLPFVPSWQTTLGGWAEPQPGWAKSANGLNRVPFFFQSNGAETFTHDWTAGQIVCRTWDSANGIGNGQAAATWTASEQGVAFVSGAVWLGRDVGNSANWRISLNLAHRSGGSLTTGDPYSSSSPFNLALGDGGPNALRGITVTPGDQLSLFLSPTSQTGPFVVIDNLTVDFTPIPCFGDANNDGLVNFSDLNIVLSNYGQSGVGAAGDLNLDDVVNFTDLNLLLSNFGAPCPTPR
ncbi:MAG: hypothetical protein AB7G17_06530 [Phycisphaerales bacterium]